MPETGKPQGNPAAPRNIGPDVVIPKPKETDPDVPTRLSTEKARVGNELSADPLPYDEPESAEALKRIAE